MAKVYSWSYVQDLWKQKISFIKRVGPEAERKDASQAYIYSGQIIDGEGYLDNEKHDLMNVWRNIQEEKKAPQGTRILDLQTRRPTTQRMVELKKAQFKTGGKILRILGKLKKSFNNLSETIKNNLMHIVWVAEDDKKSMVNTFSIFNAIRKTVRSEKAKNELVTMMNDVKQVRDSLIQFLKEGAFNYVSMSKKIVNIATINAYAQSLSRHAHQERTPWKDERKVVIDEYVNEGVLIKVGKQLDNLNAAREKLLKNKGQEHEQRIESIEMNMVYLLKVLLSNHKALAENIRTTIKDVIWGIDAESTRIDKVYNDIVAMYKEFGSGQHKQELERFGREFATIKQKLVEIVSNGAAYFTLEGRKVERELARAA